MPYNCWMRTANGSLNLDQLQKYPGYLLARARFQAFRNFERAVDRKLTLRPVEFSILLLLKSNGEVTQAQLAATLGVAAPNMTGILRRLQERDLLTREPSPSDRRMQHIVLTARGSKLIGQAVAASKSMDKAWLSRLSRGEQALLMELLRKLAEPQPAPVS